MVGEKTRTGLIVIILAVTLLMVFGLYANALSPSIVTGLGTVLLVLVTVIYTINTHEQTRATRASYAPSLDVSIYPKSDHCRSKLSIGEKVWPGTSSSAYE